MMNALRYLFTPPSLTPDSEMNRLARLLHRLLLGVLATSLTALPLQLILEAAPIWMWINLIMFCVTIGAVIILKAGRVYLTGVLAVIVGNLFTIVVNLLTPRPFAIMAVAGIISIMIVGLFASRRGLWIAMGSSIVVTLGTTSILLYTQRLAMPNLLDDTIIYVWYVFLTGYIAYLSVAELLGALVEARAARQLISGQNLVLQQEMATAERLRKQQQEFNDKLHAVTNSANLLMQCETMDGLWREAVLTAKHTIGLQRCSIFLLDKDLRHMTGTYGVSEKGALVDEQRNVIPVAYSAVSPELIRSTSGQEAIWAVNPDAVLNEWNGEESVMIGRGWMVNTLVRPKQGEALALFFNDAGLSGQPLDTAQQELLAVFCALLANVAQHKSMEIQQRQRAQGLRQVLSSADELLNTASVQEFWARAVRLGHKRLGIERLSIYVLEQPGSGLFRGTYAIDLGNHVVEMGFDFFRNPNWAAEFMQHLSDPDHAMWRYVADTELVDVYEGRKMGIGRGWSVTTPIISDNGRLMGLLFNDNAISGRQMNPDQQELIVGYTRLLGNIAERKLASERQEQVAADLRAVLSIADELMACPTIEDMWRGAVELARKHLRLERCAVCLVDPQQPNRRLGMFGTDIFHKTTDERGQSYVIDESSENNRWHAKARGQIWRVDENVMHRSWHEGRALDVQKGWVVNTPITDAKGAVIGAFFNDTAITRKALDSDQQDVIAVYCKILGSIAERKQIEWRLQDYNNTLESSVQERTLQLQRSEKYFRTIIQQSGDVISVIGVDGKIHFETPSSQEVFGHTGRIGQNSFDLIHPEDADKVAYAMLGQVSIDVLPHTTFAVRVKHTDGRWVDTESKISLLFDDNQQVQGIVVNARDVSERKQSEAALQRRMTFERVLAEISTRLTTVPFEQIGDGIDFSIETLGEALQLATCRLNEATDESGKIIITYEIARTVVTTHEWLAPELHELSVQVLKGVYRPIVSAEWWSDQFKKQQPVIIPDIAELPGEVVALKEKFWARNIHALLAIPVWIQNEKLGLLIGESCCRRVWQDDEINLMTRAAEMIGSTLTRKYAAQELQSRLDMEHLVATISGEFARLHVDEAAAGVEFALNALGTAFQVDVCRVLQYDLERNLGHNTYEWCAPGVPSTRERLQNLDMGLPEQVWWTNQYKALGSVHFTHIADMPDVARVARDRMTAMGVRSTVRVPLIIDDQIVGALGLDTVSSVRGWQPEDIRLLQVIAEVISNALARQRSSLAMQQRVQFEQLVADISSHFLQLPPERLREGIDRALSGLGAFTQVSICRLFEYSMDGLISSNTHEWCAPGVASQMAGMQQMQRNPGSWWQQQLHTQELIYYTQLAQMPPEAAGFKAILETKGVKAILSIALKHGEVILGELGLDSFDAERSWSGDDVRLLRLIAELITNALMRQRAQQQIQAQIGAEQLVADISSAFVRLPIEQIDSGIWTALRLVGEYAQADICSLYEIAEDRHTYSNTHEWCGPFISSQMDILQDKSLELEMWWWHTLQTEQIINIDNVLAATDVPDRYRQELMSRGVQSSLAISIFQQNVLIGELGLDVIMRTQAWSEDVLRVIEVVADLIGNALARKRNALALQHERDLLERRVAERTNEINKLLDVTKTVNSTLELQPLLNLILDQLKGVVAYDAMAISEFNDSESKILLFEGPLSAQSNAVAWTYDVEHDVHITELIVHRNPVLVPDVHADTSFAQAVRRRYALMNVNVPDYMASILYVPLLVRDRVIGIMALYSTTSQFYTSHHAQLANAFANQAAVAIENARLYAQAVQSAALTERSRLARELHDSVSQALFGIVLGARTVLHNGRKSDSKVLEPMEYVLKLSEAALAEMRALIFELRPESLQNEGLLIAFQKQAEALCARHRIDVRTDLGNEEPPIGLPVKEALYRIGLEAVQNTIKHAAATQIDLRLHVMDAQVILEIRDNGHGFDSNGKFPGHFGLYTMRERAEQLGGMLELSSVVNQGTIVRVSVPIQVERQTYAGQQPMSV